jgi:uncharacterized membrane protein
VSSLAAGGAKEFRAEVTPDSSVPPAYVKSIFVTATSTTDTTRKDVVKGSTTARRIIQPDMQIKTPSESSYTGDNTYNTNGTNQTTSQTVQRTTTAVYHLNLQNDGNVTDNFKVTGSAGVTGWTINYYDALTGGTDITSQVTGSGWMVNSLAAGGTTEFRAEVTPDSSVPTGYVKSIFVTATSTTDTTKKDTVKGSTTASSSRSLLPCDIGVREVTAPLNPVSRGGVLILSCIVENLSADVTATGAHLVATCNGQWLIRPLSLPAIAPDGAYATEVRVPVSRRAARGDYLVTVELLPSQPDPNIGNNRQTVKVTVR